MRKLLFLSLLLSSCVVSPPPLAMPLDGSRAAPSGGGSVAVYGAPVFNTADEDSSSFVSGGQLRYQLNEKVSLGADANASVGIFDTEGIAGAAGRLSVRYNPTGDNLSIRVGASGWTTLGDLEGFSGDDFLDFLVFDLGATYSLYTTNQTEIYVGGTAAIGFLVEPDTDTFPVEYAGLSVGFLTPPAALQVGVDLSSLFGFSLDDSVSDTILYGAATLQLRYNFGL